MLPVRATSLVAALLFNLAGMVGMACVADPPAPTQASPEKQAAAEPAAPVDPKALTPEEQALLDADPKTLTPEQNRKRGYALRKKIMQNPDSEAAKALEEARKAVESGELVIPPPGQPTEQPPADGGVVIPAPDFLKNQDQTYGKPAQ
jgi:hypothetical protein